MDNSKTNSISSEIQLLLDSQVDFPQKLQRHFVFKSDQVSNPFKFIGKLLSKGVLSDGSSHSEANFGLKEMMVRLAMMIGCTKGAEGIGGLMEALEESGNSQLISDFGAWVKQDFGAEVEGGFGEPNEDASAQSHTRKSETLAARAAKVNEASSSGAKLVEKIMSRLDDDLMEQLQGHFISRACEIVNTTEFCSSLINLKVLDENDVQLATGPLAHGGQDPEKFIKAACSKRAIGSLVVALQSSNNEKVLGETYDWLETSQVRKNNYPISVKSLANQKSPAATALFAATTEGLISLNLQTLEVTALTSRNTFTFGVAVNHNLKKVYWSEEVGKYRYRIMRSNFDGSAKEIVVPPIGDWISTLAIHEASGNVYFALHISQEIKVCNEVGENCAVVISDSSLVNYPADIALDSKNGFMYWSNSLYGSHSVVRANLDGSNSTIISSGFQSLFGITLDDPSYGILYWADLGAHSIGTFDVNDGKKRTLVELETNSGLWGIQVDDAKIYFSTFMNNTIQSVDRNSGKELTTIFKSTGAISHLALFNVPVTQP